MQQFGADSAIDLCRKVLIAELVLMARRIQIALPNRTTLPTTREAGLVQIADALIEEPIGIDKVGFSLAIAPESGSTSFVTPSLHPRPKK